MSELTFCRQFLTALDARPIKLSSDHIADARQYPDGAVFVLPKLPSPPHPQRPNPKSTTKDASSSSTTITLKPMKSSQPTITHPTTTPTTTSVYDLKTAYAAQTQIPATKIKILYKKKPVADTKTVAEVVGSDVGSEVEFSVMVLGGAVAGQSPVQSPPAAAPSEIEKGLGSATGTVPAAQGPSGKEVVAEEAFWEDLKGFVVQRIRDEKEGERLVGVFKSAWEKDR
ncbi:hypothetical protein N0V90_001504 [Kalmusia sp. IMI 367209]|nr:hypothetical protein N0V90_001504 [Kalmusia sp. IMI 367209]